MKRYTLLLISVIVILPITLPAQAPADLFSQAQQEYDRGNYTEAIELYRDILQQGIESSAVHYNLANAYYRDGELGEAILHWEKGKQLAPRDKDIRFNLEVARARVQDRIDAPPSSLLMRIYNGIKYWFTLNELGWIVGVLFLVGSLSFAGWQHLSAARFRKSAGFMLVASLILVILSGSLLGGRLLESARERYGIILVEEVKAHAAPQQMSTEVFILHEGTRAEVERHQGGWYKIRLVDGKEGWIPGNAIGIV